MQLVGHIDQYLAFKGGTGIQEGGLRGIMARSCCHKGRLLHYKPLQEHTSKEELQKWCGMHTDHGSLTGAHVVLLLLDAFRVALGAGPACGLSSCIGTLRKLSAAA